MTSVSNAPRRARQLTRNPLLALVMVAGLLAGLVALNTSAGADTTVTPSGPGAIGAEVLTRDAVVDVKVNPGGRAYKKSSSSASYAPMSFGGFSALELATACAGDNGPDGVVGSGNRTPWTKLHVTGPSGYTFDWYSPAVSPGTGAPNNPQPPGPSTSAFRGDNPAGSGFSVPVALGDAGVYTVTTTIRNVVKTGTISTCNAIGTPTPNGLGGFTSTTLPPGTVLPGGGVIQPNGLIVETHTFEYRPWQEVFTDATGQGKVSFNMDPAESQQVVAGQAGSIIPGHMTFYSVPDGTSFALPSDPEACAADPAACLPVSAEKCDPSAGCDPRIVVISRSEPAETLQGVFDLETRAFICTCRVGDTGRVLLSLGSDLDPYYAGLIAQLRAVGEAIGMDINELLDLGVTLSGGEGGRELKLTLLNGLQIDPAERKNGINLLTGDIGAEAGMILNVYAALVPKPVGAPASWCTAGSASSAGGDTRYARTVDAGFNVQKADILPNIPSAAGLEALGVGGPIMHIDARTPSPLLGLNGVLAGAAVDADGLDRGLTETYEAPLIDAHYLLDAADALTAPYQLRKFDYIGTANWAASETDTVVLGCLVVDFALGIGIQLNNNPLPIGFHNLPLWAENPAAANLWTQINAAVSTLLGTVTTNPTVAALLEQITGQLPPLPVPTP
jgi:hypothetical protein